MKIKLLNLALVVAMSLLAARVISNKVKPSRTSRTGIASQKRLTMTGPDSVGCHCECK